MADTISELLTRTRNALSAKHEYADVPYSSINEKIAQILKEEGYILGNKTAKVKGHDVLRILLKYDSEGAPVIEGIRQISTPGRRIYVKKEKIPRVKNGLGIAILSSSKGLVTDRKARELGIGGEVVCYIW